MTTILLILVVLVLALLIAVAAVTPNPASVSSFEINRRKQKNDTSIKLDSLRDALFRDVVSVQRVLVAVLLVIFVLLSVAQFGMLGGAIVAIIVALEYGTVARFGLVRSYNQKLYNDYELPILELLQKHQSIVGWLRTVAPPSRDVRINSRDELEDMLQNAHKLLSEDEKTHILSSLKFEARIVRDVMTPKSVVDTVPHSDMLGPLVLDDLHKTGHSRFPVVDGSIDNVVGILFLRDVLSVDTSKKTTARVETAMSKKVFYIREDHTLSQALSAFLRTHHHLFIVINEFHETVGILTLEDTIEALLGRKIIDEFDAHDDMRAVASRQAAKRLRETNSASKIQ